MTSPLFTVITPLYNRADLIRVTLDSLAGQECRDFEVVVVDDGSTDGGADLVARDYPWVRLVRQANAGEGAARNAGIKVAQGEYLFFLDSDDVLYPWTLATFADVIARHGRPAIINGADRFFRDDAARVSVRREEVRAVHYPSYFAASSRLLWRGVNGNAMRRDVAAQIGPFGEERINALDLDYFYRAGTAAGFVLLESPVTFAYRQHAGAVSRHFHMTYRGIVYLVEQERQGHYPGGAEMAEARRALLTSHVRRVSLLAAQHGRLGWGWDLYRRTWRWQRRLGRWRYLLGFAPLSLGYAVAAWLGRKPQVE